MKKFNIIFITLMALICILLSSSMVTAGAVTGNTFTDIQNEINNPSNGGTIDLVANTTYSGSGTGINVQNTNNLVIQGINGKATLDSNFQSYIFTVNSSSSTITFRNISFINANSSVNPGGAILAHSTIIIENCTFTNNYGQSGAAIMINPLAIGSNITNCNFTNNCAIYQNSIWGWGEGTAIDSHANNTTIKNCSFENNYGKNNGGAISLALGFNNTVINCTFINNTVDNNAGAILVKNSTVQVTNCTFTGNNASYGSAIFNDQDSELNITNCTFNNNFAATNIIAPTTITIYRPNNAIIQVSLVLGDNIVNAIYNTGNITIDNLTPVQSVYIPNQQLILTINGNTYTSNTGSSGVTIFSIPTANLALTTYSYNIVYQQTSTYKGSSKYFSLTVTEVTPPATGSNTNPPSTGPTSSTSGSTTTTIINNTVSTTNTTTNNSYIGVLDTGLSDKKYTVDGSSPQGKELYTKYDVKSVQKVSTYSNKKVISTNKKLETFAKVVTKITIKVPSTTTLYKTTIKNDKIISCVYWKTVNSTRYITINGPTKLVKITPKNKDTYKWYPKVKGYAQKCTGTKITTTYKNGKNTTTKKLKNQKFTDVKIKKNAKDKYTKYIQPSEFCESNNPKIKALGKKIVKGKKTDTAKANAILAYVQKNVDYGSYGGTHKGALGMLDPKNKNKDKRMEGNCVDQAHLTVALLRSQNIPAKYRSNQMVDKTGDPKGHAWVYALLPNKKGKLTWQSGQPTFEPKKKQQKPFGKKDEWSKAPLNKVSGHDTNNYNKQVYTKQISENKNTGVKTYAQATQTVTVNNKQKQTLILQHTNTKANTKKK